MWRTGDGAGWTTWRLVADATGCPRTTAAATAVAVTMLLSACAATGSPAGASSPASQLPTAASSGPPPPTTGTGQPSSRPAPVAITHIHAIARDPSDGTLLLATHEGLFAMGADGLTLRGPVMDLMGFAVSPDGTYYASGHPGTATRDLPQPLGLIRSTDRGHTWQVTSRGGESDFHALAAGPQQVVGFDGALRTTTDAKTWTVHGIPVAPRTLAAAPTSGTLAATTAKGLLRSTDGGASWHPLATPEPGLLVSWADDSTLVITTTGGRLATSTDQGATWTLGPRLTGAVQAMWAGRTARGDVETVIALPDRVLSTTDNGATTRPASEPSSNLNGTTVGP